MSDEPIVIYDIANDDVRIDESPFSASTTDNWVARLGGLPPYIRGVTRGVMKSGHSFEEALKIAIGVMHIWAEGRNPWSPHHTGHVTAATQAKATAALAHWEAMKAAAHAGAAKREVETSVAQVRDAMGGFIGESGSAGLFLPAGPSKKQDAAIHEKETAKPHRFHGDNLSSCDQCGQPISAAVHQGAKGPGQPIPPVPRETHLLRHRGPDHSPVSTGHIKGNAARHKKAAYAANLKNFGIAEEPLESAMKDHFGEQRSATVNRLMGKRGGRMLKRAAQNQPRRLTPAEIETLIRGGAKVQEIATALNTTQTALAIALGFASVAALALALSAGSVNAGAISGAFGLGDGYGDVTPPHYPMPGDTEKTTVEPNTTSPNAEPSFANEVAEEYGEAAAEAEADATPRDIITPEAAEAAAHVEPNDLPSVDPHDIFDQSFWTTKLTGVLRPHLAHAASLAQGAVRTQVSLAHDADDGAGVIAVQTILARRAAEAAQVITGTTAKALAGALQQGVAHGEGRDAIAQRINAVFDTADMVRAKQIAQTQVVGAYNEAASTYAMNLPAGTVDHKVWLAHHDDRTRLHHRLADGQPKPLNAPYVVGASPMMFPGDTSAPIGEWINCRCNQAFLPPGMSYGPIASAAQAYVDALRAKPPAPVSPYQVKAS